MIMKFVKCLHFFPLLLLVGLLVVLSGCGPNQSVSGSPTSDKQDKVRIEIDNQMPDQEKPVVTLAIASQVQQLSATINALSPMPKE